MVKMTDTLFLDAIDVLRKYATIAFADITDYVEKTVIYDMFNQDKHVISKVLNNIEDYYIGIDFGTNNPTVFLLIGKEDNRYYVLREYYYNARKESRQKTVTAYSQDLKDFMEGLYYAPVYVDPSATPLIAQLEEDGIYPQQADNSVLDGFKALVI
jgi:hypothetical protein